MQQTLAEFTAYLDKAKRDKAAFDAMRKAVEESKGEPMSGTAWRELPSNPNLEQWAKKKTK